MLSATPTMSKDLLVCAAGVFQGVGEDRQALEGAVVVNGLSKGRDRGSEPGRVERPGRE
jgi:hypothetical protein